MKFKSTRNQGFHMTFDNGWTISVQYGPGNYCSNRDSGFDPTTRDFISSNTAEVSIWHKGEDIRHTFEDGQKVRGFLSPDQVFDWIAFTKFKETPKLQEA